MSDRVADFVEETIDKMREVADLRDKQADYAENLPVSSDVVSAYYTGRADECRDWADTLASSPAPPGPSTSTSPAQTSGDREKPINAEVVHAEYDSTTGRVRFEYLDGEDRSGVGTVRRADGNAAMPDAAMRELADRLIGVEVVV